MFSDVRIVMDHCGGGVGPVKTEVELQQWRDDIINIAVSCPNVVVKCGGLQMVANGYKLERRTVPIGSIELCSMVLPYYRHVIQSFSPQRCMFESNFPVDKECVSHRVLYNTFKRVANELNLTPKDKMDIFHDVAVRTYRIGDHFCTKL